MKRLTEQALAGLGAIALAIILLLVWGSHRQGAANIGARPFPLTFRVVDKETQKPIAGVSVRLMRWDEPASGQSSGRTTADGCVSLTPDLTFTSQVRGYQELGGIRFWDKDIHVSADGYGPIAEGLENFAGRGVDLTVSSVPMITIELRRKSR